VNDQEKRLVVGGWLFKIYNSYITLFATVWCVMCSNYHDQQQLY